MDSTVLSVCWKEHSIALTEVCKTLLDNNFLVDCTIAAQGRSLKAHRLILSACSPYFQMLFGEECEKHPIVILQDASFDILKAMIDFMYHGETQVPEERLEAFLALAETLQIKGLNDSTKKDSRKTLSCEAARAVRRRRPSNEDIKVSCEVQSINTSHEGSPDDSSFLHSEVYTDVVQTNRNVSMERSSSSYKQVKPTSVIQPSQQQIPPQPDEVSSDAVQTLKPESLHHVYLMPKHEQVGDDESDEPSQDMHESDMNRMEEETEPAYDDQHMNHYSNVTQGMENSNVVPGTFTLPQMPGPPEAQGLNEEREEFSVSSTVTSRYEATVVCEPAVPHVVATKRSYLCDGCGDSFPTPGRLARHQRDSHATDRPFRCETCDAAFSQRCHLSVHRRVHGVRPYACDVCGDSFTQLTNLAFHKRTHAGKRSYTCDVCGRSFKQSHGLKSHKRKHTGERPYRCDVCGLTFPYPNSLKYHMRRHTGERPYLCDTCGMSFTQVTALRRHYQTHTGVKRFSCDICGKEFATKFTLQSHGRSHTDERPYPCEICGAAFRQSGALTAHVFTKHTSLGIG